MQYRNLGRVGHPILLLSKGKTKKFLNGSMRNVLSGPMGFIVPISGSSSTVTWTAGFSVTASPGSDVENVVMNIFWLFIVSVVTSVLPVIRNGSWSLENGFAGRF